MLCLSLCAEQDEIWLEECSGVKSPWLHGTKCEEHGIWKEGRKMKGNSVGGAHCHRRSARREHWLLTFKTSVWWRDAHSFPAASHPSGPQSPMIDEANGSVMPLCRACLPFDMLSHSLCLPLLPPAGAQVYRRLMKFLHERLCVCVPYTCSLPRLNACACEHSYLY